MGLGLEHIDQWVCPIVLNLGGEDRTLYSASRRRRNYGAGGATGDSRLSCPQPSPGGPAGHPPPPHFYTHTPQWSPGPQSTQHDSPEPHPAEGKVRGVYPTVLSRRKSLNADNSHPRGVTL